PDDNPIFSTVNETPAAAFVLQWRSGDRQIPELLVVEHGEVVEELSRRMSVVERLLGAPPSAGVPALDHLRCLRRAVRRRIGLLAQGMVDPQHRRLARLVVRRAAAASRQRNYDTVAALDSILARITLGVTQGEQRRLEEILGANSKPVLAYD